MRNFVRSMSHHPIVVRLLAIVDSLVVRMSYGLRMRASNANAHVLLTTTGHGNIGDQAMFEAFIHNVEGDIYAVTPNAGAFKIPEQDRSRVREVPLSDLIYGRGANHYRDLIRLGKVLRTAQSYSVTGADIMDGGYNPRLSEMEWTTAIAARMCGVSAQILGFSWNSSPAPSALALARWAGKAGVKLNVRDPQSYHRLESSGVGGLNQASDTVFLLGDADTDFEFFDIARSWVSGGGRIALVNCSGLIDTSRDLVPDYVAIVRHLLDMGYRVVLVPHVMRPDSDDLAVCRRVHNVVEHPDVFLFESLLEPRQIKALAGLASVILTGRMHLSVLGLSVATPSVVLATQGKVEGLMTLFDRPAWNIEPNEGFSEQVINVLIAISDLSTNNIDHNLSSALASVSSLSAENYVLVQNSSK